MKNKQSEHRNLLFTFDYEVFLGAKSGTVSNCLLKPTSRLMQIMSRYGVKGIFFIDTTYIARLTDVSAHFPRAKTDLDAITAQLEQLVKEGHLLYHHIHPHWLDARYLESENQWDLSNNSRFTCDRLSEKELEIVFRFSSDYLNQRYVMAGSDKRPSGYRAGGLYIEPFILIQDLFIRHGIRYDFSVIPGFVKGGGYPNYDYSQCPVRPVYTFDQSPKTEALNGPFMEYAISSYTLSGLRKILNGLDYRFNKKNAAPYGDGSSVSPPGTKMAAAKKRNLMHIKNSMSIELMNYITTFESIRQTKNGQFVQFISHPKLISEKNLYHFERYLATVTKRFNIETDFFKITKSLEMSEKINNG